VKGVAFESMTEAKTKQGKKEPSKEPLSVVKDIKKMGEVLTDDTHDPVEFELGDLVEGVVVAIERSKIVLDLGGFSSGVITGQESLDSSNTIKDLKVGDKVEAVVIGEENEYGQLILSLRRAAQENTWDEFMKKYDESMPFEMKVREANKGGLLVEEDGIRGFVPVSQLTPQNYPRVEGGDSSLILRKLEKLVGKNLSVKVINFDEKERRLILSEKAAYRGERQAVISKLKVGEKIKGRVSGIVNFGIFVNYEGVEGLVHISEVAWGHVADPRQYAKVGDEIEVLVIGIENDKISFSMKRLTKDPWAEVVDKYKIEQKVKGPVTRITPFGVFIKLEEEVEGLIHISEFSEDEHVTDPSSLFEIGEEIEAKIISIDLDEHRVGLSVKDTVDLEAKKQAAASKEEKEVKKDDKKAKKIAETKDKEDNKKEESDSKDAEKTEVDKEGEEKTQEKASKEKEK